jgi:hypothetical protein
MPSPRPGFIRSHQPPPIRFSLVGFPVARVYQAELETLLVEKFHIVEKQEIPVQYREVA